MLLERARETIRAIEQEEQELERMRTELLREKEELDALKERSILLEKVRLFIQGIAEMTRHEIVSGLEQIVTTCLHITFGDHYSFEIEVETKRNSTAVEFYLVHQMEHETLRLKLNASAAGGVAGGILDTVSIGLSFGVLKVVNQAPDGPIIFDEPAKMVDKGRAPSIMALLSEMSALFGRQVLLITHHEHQEVVDAIERVYHFQNTNDKTEATLL